MCRHGQSMYVQANYLLTMNGFRVGMFYNDNDLRLFMIQLKGKFQSILKLCNFEFLDVLVILINYFCLGAFFDFWNF